MKLLTLIVVEYYDVFFLSLNKWNVLIYFYISDKIKSQRSKERVR